MGDEGRGRLLIIRGLGAALAGWVLIGGAVAVRGSLVSGGGVLNGTLTLPEFPCNAPTVCGASVTAGFRGSFTGTDVGGHAFSVTFPDPTTVPPLPSPNLSASFGYSDNCPVATLAPSVAVGTGSGTGTFQISGGLLQRGGVLAHGAIVKGNLTWTRAGSDGVLGFSATSVSDASGVVVASGSLGAGDVAIALPVGALPASCDATKSTVTGTIAGLGLNFD